MTKQTDKKAKELSKGRDEKPQEEEEEQSADGDESEDEEQDEGDEADADESDADESDEDESEESEEEDDKAASAKPAGKSHRAAPAEEDESEEEEDEEADDEDDQDEDDEEAAAPAEPEDPYWWTPHAVLGGLVLVGVLGLFGVFNKPLGFLLSKRGPAPSETPAAAAVPAKPSPSARPFQPPGQQPQAPAEMFGAKHLLVMYKGGRRAPANVTRTKEEAKARAEEALKKIKVNKVKFEDAVAEYSDEPGAAQRGGDLREFPKGSMVPEFQAGLEKIKVGEVSDLVETPFGYHVILRTK